MWELLKFWVNLGPRYNFEKSGKYLGGQSGNKTKLGPFLEFMENSNPLWMNGRLPRGQPYPQPFFKKAMVANQKNPPASSLSSPIGLIFQPCFDRSAVAGTAYALDTKEGRLPTVRLPKFQLQTMDSGPHTVVWKSCLRHSFLPFSALSKLLSRWGHLFWNELSVLYKIVPPLIDESLPLKASYYSHRVFHWFFWWTGKFSWGETPKSLKYSS